MDTYSSQDRSPDTRAWQVAAAQVRRIEALWDDPTKRLHEILACKRWMEQQEHIPRLRRLAELLDPYMDRQQFWSVLVPIERTDARLRVTDIDVLDHDAQAVIEPCVRMPVTLVADNLRSAFNIGGLFRTADFLGAAELWLCGYSAAPDHPHVAAAAMGTVASTPWRIFDRVGPALDELRRAGVWIVALETVAQAPCIGEFKWQFPCALVLGNERFGLGPETLKACDSVVRIPSFGLKNSLNVVTAGALCAWDARQAWQTSCS